MTVNMDFSRQLSCDTATAAWQTGAEDGVARCILEQAEEAGHVTFVGRFPAGFGIPPHPHPGGEEVLVLDGSFFDGDGSYPAGSYLRLPRGYTHATETPEGCTLFVKVGQVDPAETARVAADPDVADFTPTSLGLSRRVLYQGGGEEAFLVRFAPGAAAPHHSHGGGEEVFIVEGSLVDDGVRHGAGTWLRYPDGSSHQPHSPDGCLLFVKRGHLAGR